jgi:hypothetical protein
MNPHFRNSLTQEKGNYHAKPGMRQIKQAFYFQSDDFVEKHTWQVKIDAIGCLQPKWWFSATGAFSANFAVFPLRPLQ